MAPTDNQNGLARFFDKVGRTTVAGVEEIGNGGMMVTESLYWLFFGYRMKQPVRLNAVIQQMMDIGISAIPIIALLAGSISVTLARQGIYTLRIFGAGGVKWRAEYHRFQQETQSQEYGTEVDLVADGDGLALLTAAGRLRLLEVQPAGRTRMSGADYRRGTRL